MRTRHVDKNALFVDSLGLMMEDDVAKEKDVCSNLFSKNMRKLRESHGYTLEQLGNLVGVTLTTCSRWETDGKNFRFPNPEYIDRIARVYKIHIYELFMPGGASVRAAELMATEQNFLDAANRHLTAGDWRLVKVKKN